MIFTKYKEGIQAIRTIKYKKIYGWKIYSRTRTFGAEVPFESKDGTTSMILVN